MGFVDGEVGAAGFVDGEAGAAGFVDVETGAAGFVDVETGAAGVSTGFASVTLGCGLGADCDPEANAKSSARDDENDGTCCPLVSRDTSMRVRLRTCSTVAPEALNSLISSDTNTGALPSLITVSDGADIITAAPLGAVIAASPAGALRKLRSYGLCRDASIIAILRLAPLSAMSLRILSRLKPSRRTSLSFQIWASTGMR